MSSQRQHVSTGSPFEPKLAFRKQFERTTHRGRWHSPTRQGWQDRRKRRRGRSGVKVFGNY